MPFDPTKPAANSTNSSAEMRAQLTSLKALIDAVPAGPGLNWRGDWDAGESYAAGDAVLYGQQVFVAIGAATGTAPESDPTHWRTLSITGPPGEVTNADLQTALAGTALNPNVGTLSLALSDPPTLAEVQAILDFLNALSQSLTRT